MWPHPLPQYLLICYKMCWDGAFRVTEEVTVPRCPHSAGAVDCSEPQDAAEPGDVGCRWPCRGCVSPGHHTVPRSGSVQARCPVSLSVPALRGGFQLSVALRVRLESSSEEIDEEEEEDGGSTSALEPGQAGGSRCPRSGGRVPWGGGRSRAVVAPGQRRGDPGEAVLGRLEALEADVRFLCTELGAEKLLWSSRFLELLQEQQGLRQRVSPRGPQPLCPLWDPRPSRPVPAAGAAVAVGQR